MVMFSGLLTVLFDCHMLALEQWPRRPDYLLGLAIQLFFSFIVVIVNLSSPMPAGSKSKRDVIFYSPPPTPCFRISFMLFLCFLTVSYFLTMIFAFHLLIDPSVLWTLINLCGLSLMCGYAAVLLIVLYVSLVHAAVNLTTNERINQKRYNYLKDGKGAFHNPFDRGIRMNLMEYFHLKPGLSEDQVQLLGVHVV